MEATGEEDGLEALESWRFPDDQEPRERLLRLGAAALSDPELLAVVLAGGGGGRRMYPQARWLLDTSGGLRPLMTREPGELAVERAISLDRATLLAAAAELGRRIHRWRDGRPVLSRPSDVAAYVEPMSSAHRECFRVLALNARRRLLRDSVVSAGAVDRCMVDPRDCFAPAVLVRASFLVLIHNHPSGDPMPSRTDVDLTGRMVEAAAALGIRVLDHVIVAPEGYRSMAAMDLVPEPEPMVGEVAAVPRGKPWLTADLESG